jgi:hypothetical protein
MSVSIQHVLGGFFQLGYATRDLDQAMNAFRRKFEPVEFHAYEPGIVNGEQSPTRRIALAYLDETMIEIIEPDPAQQTIFDQSVPERAGTMGLHHMGHLIDDHDGMLQRLAEAGYAVPLHGSVEGFLDYSYADTRGDLGHFSEFIRLDRGGRDFFASIPRTRTR